MNSNLLTISTFSFLCILSICYLGIKITSNRVLCEEPSRAVRKLESNIRLQSNRIKDFLDGLEKFLDSSIEQVRTSEIGMFFHLSVLSSEGSSILPFTVMNCGLKNH